MPLAAIKLPCDAWPSGLCLANAMQGCTYCLGVGKTLDRGGRPIVCKCVLRSIFRQCLDKFHACAQALESGTGTTQWEKNASTEDRLRFGRKYEEYCADFLLMAKRVLGEESRRHKLFKWHFLYGADWKACAPGLQMNRGEFFHEVYRIKEQLGRAFRETESYALYPTDEYFTLFRGGK